MPDRELRLTRLALADLAAALARCDDPKAKGKMARALRRTFQQIQQFPSVGRIAPERAWAGYRECIVPPYRVVYLATDTELQVLRIWHGRRDLRGAEFGYDVEVDCEIADE